MKQITILCSILFIAQLSQSMQHIQHAKRPLHSESEEEYSDSTARSSETEQEYSPNYRPKKQIHTADITLPGGIACPRGQCQKILTSEISLQHHLRYHGIAQKRSAFIFYECNGCSVKTHRYDNFKRHLTRCEPNTKGTFTLACTLCPQTFSPQDITLFEQHTVQMHRKHLIISRKRRTAFQQEPQSSASDCQESPEEIEPQECLFQPLLNQELDTEEYAVCPVCKEHVTWESYTLHEIFHTDTESLFSFMK